MNKKAALPLLMRAAAFFGMFLLMSGCIGPRIIAGGIVYDDYFWVYGSLGKGLLFAAVAFGLLARRQHVPALTRWSPRLLGWLAAAAAAFAVAWIGVGLVAGGSAWWVVGTHGALLLSVCLAWLACFPPRDTGRLFRAYKKQLVWAAGAAAVFYVLLQACYAAWPFLAGVVMHAVRGLLALTGVASTVVPPNTLLFDRFGITIAQSCSGVESLALFSGLYMIVALLDWRTLRPARFAIAFVAGIAGLFVCNILRVYLLILAGYFINAQVAFTLFHTYAGMVLFMVYAALFWHLSYPWITRKK